MGPGIIDYYKERKGNPAGIPVIHVGINLQRGQDALTDNFVRQAGFETVANDTDRKLARRFQPFGQPIFAIINGVANSPSHRQWELLHHLNGYGTENHPIERFRRVIDSVKAPPALLAPMILSPPARQVARLGQTVTFTVSATGSEPLLFEWRHNGVKIAASTASLVVPNVTRAQAGQYAVTISNAAGSVTSSEVELVLESEPVPAPQITSAVRSFSGAFEMRWPGQPGVTYQIQFSADLADWVTSAHVEGRDGELSYSDPGSTRQASGFYRILARSEKPAQ